MQKISQEIFLKWKISILIGLMTTGCSADINSKKEPLEGIANNQINVSGKGESMKSSIKPPASWFWSHDIDPNHIHDVVLPSKHLVRLSVYGRDKMRRFASISYAEPGIESVYLQDIAVTELENKIASIEARPISITGDDIHGQLRFSLILLKGPGPKTTVHVDLNDAEFKQLSSDQQRISDFTTYVVDGIRKYAAIVEERGGPSLIFTRIIAQELKAELRKNNVTPVRVRGFSESGIRYLTAVAERLDVGDWNWYDAIDGDTVAKKLDANNAYPFDLDAYRTEDGSHEVRYTVIMYRDPKY